MNNYAIFILDHIELRRNAIVEAIDRECHLQPTYRTDNWAAFEDYLRKNSKKPRTEELVIFAENAEYTLVEMAKDLRTLRPQARRLGISAAKRDSSDNATFLQIPENGDIPTSFISELRGFFSVAEPPAFDDAPLAGHSGRILKEQVRRLSKKGDMREAKEWLRRFVGDFHPNAASFALVPLSQGFSGSVVLHAIVTLKDSRTVHCILKLTEANDRRKVENEVKNWGEIERALGKSSPLGTCERHTPILLKQARFKDELDPLLWVVKTARWFCVAYDFLGPDLGYLGTLHDLYSPDAELLQHLENSTLNRPGRDRFSIGLQAAMDHLGNAWHGNRRIEEKKSLWNGKDQVTPVMAPPFAFTGYQKAELLKSLSVLAPIAIRLQAITPADVDILAQVIEEGKESLAEEKHVAISSVHGDLNSSNVFLRIGDAYPYFIDFAAYHQGLLVEDFARLEVEIKFFLMDGQMTGLAPAPDIHPAQLPRWYRLEDALFAGQDMVDSPSGSASDATRVLNLVKQVRQTARRIHGKVCQNEHADFHREYLAALLYHTIRAMSYDLSLPKHIYAIHSASRILSAL